ncbi:MAG: GFA family protein [Pseudomonadales bacterium]
MIRGSCLCGRVRFEVDRLTGPFELCHCSRCRKVTGSAFAATVGAMAEDFRWLCGAESIGRCELPVRERPPSYALSFCTGCGSALPSPPECGFFEIPAGLLDDDPGLRPDKHIYVEFGAPWWTVDDGLPCFTKAQIAEHRARAAELHRDA